MMASVNRWFAAFFLVFGIIPSFAQTEGTQYFMNSLPQVSINNPAFVPRYNFSIGVPGLSSVAAGYYNSGFSYNDLITKSNGEVKADLPKWVKSLGEKNYITNTAQVDLLRVGARINPKVYLQLSATGYAYTRLQVPKGAASLFVDGTAPLVGTSTHFSPQGEGIAYLESTLAAAYTADEQLTVGARVKYINGLANATTVSSSMDVSVGNDYQLTASSDLNLKTSGIHDSAKDLQNAPSNNGFAVDLGATYKLTDKLTLAASMVDLGKIRWKHNLYSYTLDKNTATYTFSGVDLKEVVAGNNSYLNTQQDSIESRFKLQENLIGSYSTSLPLKMFLSGSYDLKKDLSVGALFFTEKFQGRFNPGGTVSLSKHVGKWMSATVSYTVSNRSYNNLGAGVSFNLKPVQFYFAGDNLLGVPASLITTQQLNGYINSTQVFNLRFGINFVWGRFDKLSKNTAPVGGKSVGTRNEKVTDGTTKSLGKEKGAVKTKATKGNPTFLKVREKHRVNRKVRK